MPGETEDASRGYDDECRKAHIDILLVFYSTGCLKKKRTPEEVTMADAARLTSMTFVMFYITGCLKEKRMPEEVTMVNAARLTSMALVSSTPQDA
jgi:hypothetical protein